MTEPQTTEELEYRQRAILSTVLYYLAPRPDDPGYGEKLSIKVLGRALGFLMAVTELQALIEVRERGMEERETILSELNRPPFKFYLVPDGWESPCVSYIRNRLYSSETPPDTAWPLNGRSSAERLKLMTTDDAD